MSKNFNKKKIILSSIIGTVTVAVAVSLTIYFVLNKSNENLIAAKYYSGDQGPLNTFGQNGDSYINKTTYQYYEKSRGVWDYLTTVFSEEENVSPYSAYRLVYRDYTKTFEEWKSDLKKGYLKTTVTYFVRFDSNGGTTVDSQQVISGYKVNKPKDPELYGSNFLGWKEEEGYWNFDDDRASHDMTLTANWEYMVFTIQYNLDGGTVDGTNPSTYNVETKFDLIPPTKPGSIFLGWYDADGNMVDEHGENAYGNLVLTARWSDRINATSDQSYADITVRGGDTYESRNFFVKADAYDGQQHLFKGWYTLDGKLISKSNPMEVVFEDEIINIVGKFFNEDEISSWNEEHSITPKIDKDKKIVEYGLYPQSLVSDEALIEQLEKCDEDAICGYVCYENEYYAKVEAKPFSGDATFDDGTTIIRNETYYFSVEPIEWSLLSTKDDDSLLATKLLLDTQIFYHSSSERVIDDEVVYPNNYYYSDLREWNNNGFYNKAFVFGGSFIGNSSLFCDDETIQNDLVFTLSYNDYLQVEYGYDTNPAVSNKRLFKVAEYARAKGAAYSLEHGDYPGYSWTRTPHEDSTLVYRNNVAGSLNFDYVGANYSCARPAIVIKN